MGLAHFEKGAIENFNPELGIDDQADLLPYDRKWEYPRENLKLGIEITTYIDIIGFNSILLLKT